MTYILSQYYQKIRKIFMILILTFSLFLIRIKTQSIDYSCLHKNNWLLNNNDDDYSNSQLFNDTKTNILESYYTDDPLSFSWKVVTSGIPYYNRVFTTDDISKLNSRPNAATDFVNKKTSAISGGFYSFGEDIGYVDTISRGICDGYWPPVTSTSIIKMDGCPIPYNTTYSTSEFTLSPAKEISSSYRYDWSTEIIMGRAVNGILLYNGLLNGYFEDWTPLAPSFDIYSFDICNGHADRNHGIYHHHSYSECLASEVSDYGGGGGGHSPIYGFANDGFPIYGPYQSSNVFAQSCWQIRNYSASVDTVGCIDGKRSCHMIDEYDYTKGTVISSSQGPSFTAIETTPNGNQIIASHGMYYEDYYYNTSCTTQGINYLDQYNGHRHGSYGYHYHMTINSSTSTYNNAVFPYITGPQLYGCIYSLSESRCNTTSSDASVSKAQCVPASSSSSNTVSTFVIGTILLVIFLFGAFIVAGFCFLSCMRRLRKLAPAPNYNLGPSEDDFANLPQAECVARPKEADGFVGVEVYTASGYEVNGNSDSNSSSSNSNNNNNHHHHHQGSGREQQANISMVPTARAIAISNDSNRDFV